MSAYCPSAFFCTSLYQQRPGSSEPKVAGSGSGGWIPVGDSSLDKQGAFIYFHSSESMSGVLDRVLIIASVRSGENMTQTNIKEVVDVNRIIKACTPDKRAFRLIYPVLFVCLCLAYSACRKAESRTPVAVVERLEEKKIVDKEETGDTIPPLLERDGVRILVLEGDPERRGRMHGTLLRDDIRMIVQKYVHGFVYPEMGGRAIMRVIAASTEEHIDEETKVEMKALAEAAGVPYEDILVLNAHLDSYSSTSSTVGLTAEATSAKPLLGRNIDWTAPPDMEGLAVMMVVRQKGKHAFANYTYPGFLGVLTGLNSAGVAVSMNAADTKDAARLCTPTPLLVRYALEENSSAEDFLKYLENRKRCSGFIITAVDSSNRARVLEYTTSMTSYREPEHEVLASTNHFLTEDMRKFQAGSVKESGKRLGVLRDNCTYIKGTPLGLGDLKGALNVEPVYNRSTLMSVIVSPAENFFEVWQAGDEKGAFSRVSVKKLMSGSLSICDSLPLDETNLKDPD